MNCVCALQKLWPSCALLKALALQHTQAHDEFANQLHYAGKCMLVVQEHK